jgi:signal-transduction protein with cAMP-binding, CBS, and nucleotidyltransferase domain
VNEKKLIRIRDVMKDKFDMVDGMETVEHALNTMNHLETKSLIVKKRDENDEYGMVTLSDIARKVIALDRSPDRVNVYEIMSKPVVTVSPNMDIRYCARLFSRFNLTRAPVVEDGKVIGFVSFTDMVVKGLRKSE